MFSTTKMLFRRGTLNLVSLNPLAVTPLSATTSITTTTTFTQSCRFASNSSSKSASKKKSTKSTKSKRKTASKSAAASSSCASKKRKQTKSKSKAKSKEAKPKSFMATLGKSDKKLLKKYPDPARPKRPLSAFSRYIQSQSDTKLADAAKLWKELDESRKNEYRNEFQSEFPSYQAKYNDYKEIRDKSVEEWLHVIKQLENDKPPRNGYLGFISENKNLFSGQGLAHNSQKIKDLASQWQNLPSYEKESYKSKYSKLLSEWKDRVQSYYQ